MTADAAATPTRQPNAMQRAQGVIVRLVPVAMVMAILGIPVTDFWRFLLLSVAIMAICFGHIRRRPSRWLAALAVTAAIVAANWLLPGPRIQEGHNVYIPVGANLKVFEDELPKNAQRIMKSVFDRAYFVDTDGLPGSPEWWKEWMFRSPGYFTKRAFAASADALWQRPKYSRIVDAVDFKTQDQARIGAINRLPYNFYGMARIDRRDMPFFVMVEINDALAGGQVCWRGEILWEEDAGRFTRIENRDRTCRAITEEDSGRKIFALSIAPNKPLEFAVIPPPGQRAILWARAALRFAGVLAVLGALVRIEAVHRMLLPLGAVVATLLTIIVMKQQYLFGFRTHNPGNDGLTHESLGFDIARAVFDGRWAEALRGGRDIFYFMPGLRYFHALEDMLFGDTSYGIVLATMFLSIFLYYFIRRLLPLRWSAALIVVFLFTPIFERFGFALFVYLRQMIKGFAEPLGYGAFLGALALIARHVPGRTERPLPGTMPTAWIGLALAVSVAMRPNLAIAAALILAMVGLWLLTAKRPGELLGLIFGFAPILLVALHNWYFGGQFVPLTAAAFIPANLLTPPSVYAAALGELLRLDFGGGNFARVASHLDTWNGWNDFYRIVAFLVVVWVAFRRATPLPLRALAAVALSMQAVLFFYLPTGRYSHLAWLLVFVILMATIREIFLPWTRQNHPRRLAWLASLTGIRHIAALLGSPRWTLAYELSRITPAMGLLEGFKVECRPLVSPLRQVLLRLPRGGSVFDIGCGSGSLLHLALIESGVARAAGYDVSAAAVAAARALPWPPDRLAVTRRSPEQGVPDLSDADTVTMCDVLHHIPADAKARLIGDVANQMRPGAVLVLTDIDAGRRFGRWMNQFHDLVVSREWVAPVTSGDARAMIEEAGLSIREALFVRSLWYPHYLIVAAKPAR